MAVVVVSILQSYWACIQDMYQCLLVATEGADIVMCLLPQIEVEFVHKTIDGKVSVLI